MKDGYRVTVGWACSWELLSHDESWTRCCSWAKDSPPPLLKTVGVTAERPADNDLCVFQEADWCDIREPDHSWFGLRAWRIILVSKPLTRQDWAHIGPHCWHEDWYQHSVNRLSLNMSSEEEEDAYLPLPREIKTVITQIPRTRGIIKGLKWRTGCGHV